jgi:hypothetical protein
MNTARGRDLVALEHLGVIPRLANQSSAAP